MRSLLRFFGRWFTAGAREVIVPQVDSYITSPVYAARRRERIATTLLAGHLGEDGFEKSETKRNFDVDDAIAYADALIARLDAPPVSK